MTKKLRLTSNDTGNERSAKEMSIHVTKASVRCRSLFPFYSLKHVKLDSCALALQ